MWTWSRPAAEGDEMLFWLSGFSLPPQFVPFRDYMDRTGNHVLSMARLAKDVLAEIPDQLISYMKSRAIKPNPVPPAYSTGTQPPSNPVWADSRCVTTLQRPVHQSGSCSQLLSDAEAPCWFWRGRSPASRSGGGRGVNGTFRCLLSTLLSKMVTWWIANKPVERVHLKAYMY